MPDAPLSPADRARLDTARAAARDGPARTYGPEPDRSTVAHCLSAGLPIPAEIVARTVFHLWPRTS